MSTKIEWTDDRWNPVTGCTKVSAGCKNCYAEGVAKRFWKGRAFTDVRLHPERLDAPLRWRKPRMVFVNSMSDLFHEDVPDEFIAAVFGVMGNAPTHTFQILTKRPKRMRRWFSWVESVERGPRLHTGYAAIGFGAKKIPVGPSQVWPYPNVWLGVSAEDQATADERIPVLLDTPAAVRFVSCEPLLGPIRLDDPPRYWLGPASQSRGMHDGLDWVIVGGESGPKARPFNLRWLWRIKEDCEKAGVPLFVKQLGARPVFSEHTEHGDWLFCDIKDRKGGDPEEWPEDLRVREYPRKARA